MFVHFEVDDQEIVDAVKETIIQNTVKYIEEKLYKTEFSNYDRRIYHEAIKQAVRETVKKNAENIIDRSITYAGEYIGKKGLKKMIDEGNI